MEKFGTKPMMRPWGADVRAEILIACKTHTQAGDIIAYIDSLMARMKWMDETLQKRDVELEETRRQLESESTLNSLVYDERRHYLPENERLRTALEKIAGQDYRGNRPYEQTIAYEALNGTG